MEKRFITIASYSMAHQAHLLKSKLESEGIPCILADEFTITMNWFYANALGGIKVQIPYEFYDDALKIIDEDLSEEVQMLSDEEFDDLSSDDSTEHEESFEIEAGTLCPYCHSDDIRVVKLIHKETLLSKLTFGLIHQKPMKKNCCNICLNDWIEQ
ncbi:MAG TPA: DUF2007 domain-containing protein [Balneolales bacterium]|nr:DUF2007 domain-containing protein [Balneolales bacterium]